MNLELIIKEILLLSKNINDTYDRLMDLSYKNLEDTNQFLELLEDLDYYFTEEDDLYNNLDIDTIRKLLMFFNEESHYDDDALRGFDKLDERYGELLDEINDDNLDDEKSSVEEIYLDSINSSNQDILFDNYYEEIPDYLYKYRYIFLNNIYINAVKNMIISLDNMVPNDMNEKVFLSILKNSFRVFKYDYLTINTLYEKLSLSNRFNPSNMEEQIIPIEYDYLDSISIYYNEGLRIISLIYEARLKKMDDENTLNLLFYNSILDLLLGYLDYERLTNLENYLYDIDNTFNNNFHGEICLSKIRSKKREL